MSFTTIVKRGEWIRSRPILAKIFIPIAKTYASYAGYREMGLKLNDLFAEETPVMQKALSRLPEAESYARNFRILTAHQCALTHSLLPADKAIQPEEDTHYLLPYILEAEKEALEKAELDNMKV
ncbi:QCR7 [[Candida] subhashii]|uniref:Cytochrome b-c1 complex subunit 7 n=1 Tax=[Candida] subhashii TaxID=561895 RepID=A0A8J5QJX8_9ASCO|nr:QCR7 [[Candida] subhashii]KAG7662122.1 QCR7 [[Candida] subhashii]